MSAADAPRVDASRVIADLRELDRRTGGAGGARRVCWGPEWREARGFVTDLLADIGLQPERDEAANAWAYLEGDAEPASPFASPLAPSPSPVR